jgi:hypothetical protein
MLLAVPASAAPAITSVPSICLPVYLTATGQDLGPDTEGHLMTTSTVLLAGHPVATTKATFTPSGSPTGDALAFTGPIVFTFGSQPSTLTANVQGSVNLSTGVFQATSITVTGVGLLSGVSGSLVFRGTENLATGAFTETIRGTLCSRMLPW